MRALDPAISDLCNPISANCLKPVGTKTKEENIRMLHDNLQMSLRSLVFIGFQGCPICFRANLIKCAHVGFNSKIHFPLSNLSASIVKIGPLEKKSLVPWLEFVIELSN